MVRAEGFIEPREERRGGPLFRYACPACGFENLCETTARGTFFASPPFQPTLIDWFFSKLEPHSAETFLRAAAWFRREAERRRYVFERDGDYRYSSRWERVRRFFAARAEEPAYGEEIGQAYAAPGVPSPHEILGLAPGAGAAEVTRAFHRLAARCHPDKFHYLGPEAMRRAEERFKELLAAYEKLRAGR
ncbi:MAG: Chaperone protein DnaJ [Planctomycetes bacterium ADurb.Bin069]|nr:MAG: Chaperone protein DnaJ [Planctomycetes bacterium ADurb.Bin069]